MNNQKQYFLIISKFLHQINLQTLEYSNKSKTPFILDVYTLFTSTNGHFTVSFLKNYKEQRENTTDLIILKISKKS